jgi:hypothetical protein
MSLDSFLNFIIPTGVFLWLGFKVYQSVQNPADRFFAWIKEQMAPEEELNENRFVIDYD